MYNFYSVSFLLLLKFPFGAMATPVASDDNLAILSTDYSLFSGEDVTSLGNGNDIDSIQTIDSLPDLSDAGPSCSNEASLWDEEGGTLGLDDSSDFVVRDLSDGSLDGDLFAAGICEPVPPRRRKKTPVKTPEPEPELQIPQVGFAGGSGDRCADKEGFPVPTCCVTTWVVIPGTLTFPMHCESCKFRPTHINHLAIFFSVPSSPIAPFVPK